MGCGENACYSDHMLAQWYLNKQLQKAAPAWAGQVHDLAALKRLAGLDRLIFLGSRLLCVPDGVLRQVYSVQDQTEQSREKALQIAASLASAPAAPLLLRAISLQAKKDGLPLREVEVDSTIGQGVVGKLDRTWYVLGDAYSMQSERVELGVATLALAQQIEADGSYPFFLAMQGPKRLLAVLSCQRQLRPEVAPAFAELRRLGITPYLITDEAPTVAARFYGQLPGLEIRYATSVAEQKIELAKLITPTAAVAVGGRDLAGLPKELFSFCFASSPQSSADLNLSDLTELTTSLSQSREAVHKLRQRFFWRKL